MPTDEFASAPARRKKKSAPKHLTWEHPKGSGIKIAEVPNRHKGQSYGVSYRIRIPADLVGGSGKREMFQRTTKVEAERLAEDRFLALKKHGTEFSKIPPAIQKQAAVAWGLLEDHNRAKREEAARKNGGTPPADFAKHELNLIDTLKAGIQALSPEGGLRSLSEVCAELRASKATRFKDGGIDASTERDFRNRSLHLEAAFGDVLVNTISVAQVTKVLSGLRARLAQRSVLNYRNALAEILGYAKAKQYAQRSPLESLTREDYKKLGGETAERNLDGINILKVEEARRLLNAARGAGDSGMLATVVLRLFCGVRTAEVSRLDWGEVHWLDAKPFVHIPASKAKKRRIRHIEIPPNALAWLKLCNPPASGLLDARSPKKYTQRFARIAKLAGLGRLGEGGKWESDWENNDTRHSFASYHYALHGDAMLTARLMGHKQNDDVLFAHYRTLVTQGAAQDYFGILPPTGSSNVTEFPKAATA